MVRSKISLLILLLVLTLRQSDAVFDDCSELQNEIARLEGHVLQRITELEYRNEILEKLKKETHVSETDFRSLKFDENEFKSKLQQSEGIISSFQKQLERSDGILQNSTEKRVQVLSTISSITETVGSLNQTAQLLCERQKQLQATIDDQTKTEEANNRTVQELREKEKQLQATINGLKKAVETLNQTEQLRCVHPKDACRYLIEAAKSGDVDSAKRYVNCTNDSCTTDDGLRKTPLIYAADSGHVELVRVLLEGGANVERANANQQTALHYASWYGYVEVCRLLLDWGAKVNPLDKWKDTPLHDAARLGQLSAVKLLVERGADVGLKNDDGRTASDLAWRNGKLDVAEWLNSLSRG